MNRFLLPRLHANRVAVATSVRFEPGQVVARLEVDEAHVRIEPVHTDLT